jgi:hypothetical protein
MQALLAVIDDQHSELGDVGQARAGRRDGDAEIAQRLPHLQPEVRRQRTVLGLAALAGDEDEARSGGDAGDVRIAVRRRIIESRGIDELERHSVLPSAVADRRRTVRQKRDTS